MQTNPFRGFKNKEEPFVTVLTPVYNGEKYLRECIESVLSQTYTNWEYVLVNNQSTDRSLQIMEEYCAQDSRIRIYNNEEHLSQMLNLNHAFRQISPESKYCKVVHADDWLFPECITRMVELNEAYPTIGVVSAYRLDDKQVGLAGLPYPSHFVTGLDIARSYFLDDTFYFGAPTSLLIRSDLIRKRNRVYVESHQGTDTGACLDLLKESDFGFVHQVLTFTRRHRNSITNTEARDTHAFIHAKLYNTLQYAPYFLTKKEYNKCLVHDLRRYYIMLARNLYENRSISEFKRQLQILDELDLKFEIRSFIKNFIRETGIQLFNALGIELKKVSENRNFGSQIFKKYAIRVNSGSDLMAVNTPKAKKNYPVNV